MDVSVRRLVPADLPAVADLHMAAFPDAAITAVGHEAVRRYYAWQCDPIHDAVGLVALRDGRVVGYCFGGVFRGALSGYLRANFPFLAFAVARHPARMLRTAFRARIVKGLRMLRRTAMGTARQTASAAPPPGPSAFGILAIAADPRAQRAGVGRALMAEAEAEARRAGFARMQLSVHPANEAAVRFYEALGWHKVARQTGWAGEMQRSLAPQ